LTGQLRSPDDFEAGDFRKYAPRFSKEASFFPYSISISSPYPIPTLTLTVTLIRPHQNFPKNLEIVDKIEQLAKKKNVTSGQLALAWLLAQGDDIFPIPG
jgi:hypothetical protein